MEPKYAMTTDIPASITTPDVVETRMGTLKFFDGFPDDATVEKLYEHLDFQRGVQAFLTAIPMASLSAVRTGFRSFGPDNRTVLISETLMDSRSLFLTANTETIYNAMWLDVKDGPLVIEVPPKVLGMIDDFWFRYVTDVGNVGPDKGQGGKYLLVPPDYDGEIPDGYFVARSRTYGNILFFRAFPVNGDLRPAVESTKQYFRVYPWAQADNPPEMTFVDFSGKAFNTIHASDASFYAEVNQAIQEEPLDATDPETLGLLASIGIQKGKPFAPDARMQRILADAAAVGNATARTIAFSTRDQDAYYYPNSAWKVLWIGNDYQFSPGGVLNLDARTLFFYNITGISPVMAMKMVGASSKYVSAERDARWQYLDGAKSYRLHLPPNVPLKNFWSLVVYDPQTRSMLQTDQRFPSVSSQKDDLVVNPDTSVDIYFGPQPPPGKEPNWVQTIPGKGWWVIFRLYGPLEPWFDKSWRPGEIEEIGEA